MPNQPVTVRIQRSPNRLKCLVVPQIFGAQPGASVTFQHADDLPPVRITFPNGSPFNESSFMSGPTEHTVTSKGKFDFDVSWNEPEGPGQGNGSGEVPPG